MRRRSGWLLGLALTLVALNLRPAVGSIGPVLEDIRVDLGLSAAAVAVLGALPVLCFGLAAFGAPRLARRWGMDRTLGAAIGATATGLLLRIASDAALLFVGTLLTGAAIAVGNVLLPALVKRDFSHRPGLMMGVYTCALVGSSAVAAALTVPLAEALGRGWRGGLGVWAVPAVVALVVWLAVARARRGDSPPPAIRVSASLARDAVAWQVTVFFGVMAFGFYAVLTWLPTIYRSYGLSPSRAGFLLGLATGIGIPIALVVPTVITRAARQSGWVAGFTAITFVGLMGLLLAPMAAPVLWAVLIGIGQGAIFPLCMTLVLLRTTATADAAQLAAMAQGVGYLLAAAGPFIPGLLHDWTGGWEVPVAVLVVLLLPQLIAGMAAGRDVYVGAGRR